ARLDFIAELDVDGDAAILDVDFDLVFGDAWKLGLDDVGFRRLDDVERNGPVAGIAVGIYSRKEHAEGTIEYPVERVVVSNQVAHICLLQWVCGEHAAARATEDG